MLNIKGVDQLNIECIFKLQNFHVRIFFNIIIQHLGSPPKNENKNIWIRNFIQNHYFSLRLKI